MIAKSLKWIVLAAVLITPLTVAAGHHYQGGQSIGKDWDMSAMDTDRDRALSFEEYSQTKLDYLRKGFDRIDTNDDNLIDEAEWKVIREAHGVVSQE
jgi:hypothetical protein